MIYKTKIKVVNEQLEGLGIVKSEWRQGYILLHQVSNWYADEDGTILNTPVGSIYIADHINDFTAIMNEYYKNV